MPPPETLRFSKKYLITSSVALSGNLETFILVVGCGSKMSLKTWKLHTYEALYLNILHYFLILYILKLVRTRQNILEYILKEICIGI